MSFHPNLAPRFVAAPSPRKASWAALRSRMSYVTWTPIGAAIGEALDVLGNVAALASILALIAAFAAH